MGNHSRGLPGWCRRVKLDPVPGSSCAGWALPLFRCYQELYPRGHKNKSLEDFCRNWKEWSHTRNPTHPCVHPRVLSPSVLLPGARKVLSVFLRRDTATPFSPSKKFRKRRKKEGRKTNKQTKNEQILFQQTSVFFFLYLPVMTPIKEPKFFKINKFLATAMKYFFIEALSFSVD